MGTTLTAMLWSGGHVGLCHIGDSRAYLLRDGELFQITRDHTLVQSLVDEGRITPRRRATTRSARSIMRALDSGDRGRARPVHAGGRLGDRYLLCSDGLSDVVSDETCRRRCTS